MKSGSSKTFVKLLAVVLGAILLGAAIGGAAAALRPQTYTSTAVVMVTPAKALPSNQAETVSQFILNNMATYHNLATTSKVLEGAKGWGETPAQVSSNLSVEVPNGSSLIQLKYTDADASKSANIADGLAGALQDSIHQFSPQPDGSSQVDVNVVQDAKSATVSNKPSVVTWATVGGVIGAAIGLIATQSLSSRRRSRASAPRAREASRSAAWMS